MKLPASALTASIVAGAVASAAATQDTDASAARPPNVVLIVVDDLGQTDVGCYGSAYYETPNIDRLARQGARFTQGYAACAVCSPTRAAILTGRYPARLGVTDWIHHASDYAKAAAQRGRHEDGFDPPQGRALSTPRNRPWLERDEITIAELLKPLGYATCHVGKWHLGPEGWHPEDQGFDENHGGCRFGQPPSYFDPYTNRRFDGIPTLPSRDENEYLTDREAAEAVSFIDRHKDRPFFLQLCHYAVHSPLQAPEQAVAKYRAKQKTHQNVPVYAAMVEAVDRAVGRVLEALDRHDLTRNTIVVFTSDNGGAVHFRATNNAPLRKGKGHPYEGGLRVPFVVRWPGVVVPGTVSDVPVCSIDLFPTIAEATGAPLPDGRTIDGASLVPLWRGAIDLGREALVWHFPHYWWGTRIKPYSVIRDRFFKLIRHYQDSRYELYDLVADPSETLDLAERLPLVVERLDRALQAALDEQGAKLPVVNPERRTDAATPYSGPPRVEWFDATGWPARVERPWPGPHLWTNPMEDWRVRGAWLEVLRTGPDRNVQLVTRALGEHRGDFRAQVVVKRIGEAAGRGSAGIRIGIRGPLGDYRNALIHGSGVHCGFTTDGLLFIDFPQENQRFEPLTGQEEVELSVSAEPIGSTYLVTLIASKPETREELGRVTTTVAADRLVGNIGLVNGLPIGRRGGRRGGTVDVAAVRHAFRDWRVSGSKLAVHDERAFGPILWTQYTLSRGVLKLTAQLTPVGRNEARDAGLQVKLDGTWATVAGATVDPLSRTATFRVVDWASTSDVPYRVVYALRDRDGVPENHYWGGVVRREPRTNPVLTLAAFTGNTDAGFPNDRLVRNVLVHDPDLLFFSGDQIYESVGGFGIHREPVDVAVLSYLRKWYVFGWAFRDLMRDRPTVILPDDHDVYQGNIWGNGGNPTTIREHPRGGFAMHPDFVNVVMRTQTAHLPDPFDPTPIQQGIGVCYTDMSYGGVSFAILEDRKFKAGPQGLVESGSDRPDHVKDKSIDVAALDVPDAPLLGERQLRFLDAWARDWRDVAMKAVLSQTIFANVANYHGPRREFLVADLDSNAWPQSGRNRALRAMRKACAVHIAGDQHLASIVHHGIDAHRDAGLSFCVPSIAAGYPRAWRPDEEGRPVQNRPADGLPNTGDYRDGLGHPITVHAIGNPDERYRRGVLERLHDKASGYGLVRFDKDERTITFECWRLLFDAADPKDGDQFPGWPMTFSMFDNDGRHAEAHLPTIRVSGMSDPVVQVFDERSGELVSAVRIRGAELRPKVFDAAATYRVLVGEPGTERTRELTGVRPGDGELEVTFPARRD